VQELSGLLARAFEEDPWMSWMFQEPKFRATLAAAWMKVEIQCARNMGSSWLSLENGEVVAGSIWAPPGKDLHEGNTFRQLWYLVLGANPGRADELLKGLSKIGEMHPKQPHYYLNTVGVEPELVGRGHGGDIIRHTLDHADQQKKPCYLESSSERNIPLYERLGFKIIHGIEMPDGPTMWGMWRSIS
jgi:ribosomal protein S18 acetylase RimI-like enzyme